MHTRPYANCENCENRYRSLYQNRENRYRSRRHVPVPKICIVAPPGSFIPPSCHFVQKAVILEFYVLQLGPNMVLSFYWVLVVSCMFANAALDATCKNEKKGKIIDIREASNKQCSIRVCEDGGKSGTGMLKNKCKKLLSEWQRIGGSKGNMAHQKSCSYRKEMFQNLSVVDVKKRASGRVKITICVNGKVVRNFLLEQNIGQARIGIEAWNPFGKKRT